MLHSTLSILQLIYLSTSGASELKKGTMYDLIQPSVVVVVVVVVIIVVVVVIVVVIVVVVVVIDVNVVRPETLDF